MDSTEIKNSSVFSLAWPVFIQVLLAMCLGYVDSIMLSKYSETAVGAIGNANQVISFMTLAFSIISSATGVVVSQYLGAKQKDKISEVYTVSIAFNFSLSLLISIIVFFGSNALLSFMKVPKEMFVDANNYMKIVGGFIFTQALIDTMSQIFRSNGKVKVGMFLSLGMNIINIIGNYLFLYGPLEKLNFGASGVAISTTFSRLLCVIISAIYFAKKIEGNISIKYFKPFPKDTLFKLLKIGLPTAGENISYNVSQIVVTMFVNMLGTVAITTKIYGNILSNFAYMYSISVATATSIIVGHSIGSSDEEYAYNRVLKTLRSALVVSMSIAVFNYIISGFTFGLFTNNPEIISLGRKVMIVAIFLEFGRTSNLVIINSMKAAGDVKFPVALGIVAQWGCSVGLGYLFGIYLDMGLVGIWIAMALDEIVRGIIVYIRWKLGGWRNKSLVME